MCGTSAFIKNLAYNHLKTVNIGSLKKNKNAQEDKNTPEIF